MTPHGREPVPLPAEPVVLPDVLQFLQWLWAVVHGLDRLSKRMSGDIGVTGPQRLVLRVVGLLPGLSAGALARVLHVHPSTLTGVLRRLVAQRLLERSDDPADRRRAVLRLTPAGARVNAVRRGTVEAAVRRALERASSADRAAAERVLEHIAAQLRRLAVQRDGPRRLTGGRRGTGTRSRAGVAR